MYYWATGPAPSGQYLSRARPDDGDGGLSAPAAVRSGRHESNYIDRSIDHAHRARWRSTTNTYTLTMTLITTHRSIQIRRQQRGQSTVEIAILLPILLVLLFGIIMAAFMFYAYIQVTNATREGARAGSVYRITAAMTTDTLQQTVQKAIYDPSTTPPSSALGFLAPTGSSFDVTSDVSCTLNGASCSSFSPGVLPRPGDRLRVTVVYRYRLPVDMPPFPQPFIMMREVTMEIQ